MTASTSSDDPHDQPLRKAADYVINALIVAVITLALALPYSLRVRFMGALVQYVIGPIAGYRRRALRNLDRVWPQMSPAERGAIASKCLNNAGRSFIENYSAKDFPQRMTGTVPTGPGAVALREANEAGQPVIPGDRAFWKLRGHPRRLGGAGV